MDKLMSSFCSISLCFHSDWHGSNKRVRVRRRCGAALVLWKSFAPQRQSPYLRSDLRHANDVQDVRVSAGTATVVSPHPLIQHDVARERGDLRPRLRGRLCRWFFLVRRSTYARRLLNDSQTAIWNLFDAILIARCVRVTHCCENTPCPARHGSFWISFICQRSLDGFTCVCQSVYVRCM